MKQFLDCPLPPHSMVWVYLRDSGGPKQDLSSQIDFAEAYCAHHQLRIMRRFVDAATSGRTVDGRDQFLEMTDLARKHKKPMADAIVYWDTARFGRNWDDSQFHMAELRRKGYKVFPMIETVADSNQGRLYESMLLYLAAEKSQATSRDVTRSLRYLVQRKDEHGNYLSLYPGTPPTGYKLVDYDLGVTKNDGSRWITPRLVPNEDLWAQGVKAWEMRAKNISYRKIDEQCKLLKSIPHYHYFFSNPIYKGELHWKGLILPDFVQPMASEETWELVQGFRNQQKCFGVHPRQGKADYLLSGLCICSECQSHMHEDFIRSNRGYTHRYYRCNRKSLCNGARIGAEKTEQLILDTVLSQILDEDYIMRLFEEIERSWSDVSEIEYKRKQLAKEETFLRLKINNLTEAIEKASGGLDVLVNQLDSRSGELTEVRKRLDELSRQDVNLLKISPAVIKLTVEQMKICLHGDDVAMMQQILKSFIEKIELSQSLVKIFYKFPLFGICLKRVSLLETNPKIFVLEIPVYA